MGLPIWRSPPPSPRPSTATLCDVGPARTSIRRRTSPRTSPRDGAHRFVPMPRSSRATLYPVSRRASTSAEASSSAAADVRSSTRVAVSLLNMRLQRLQLEAVELSTQRRELLAAHNAADENGRAPTVPSDTNDYGVPYAPELDVFSPSTQPDYERAVHRHQNRILGARHEIARLEDEGLQLNDQRRRLDRLWTELLDRHAAGAASPLSHARVQGTSSLLGLRDDAEPVPRFLGGGGYFTSSPQPMHETLSAGAVRASSPAFSEGIARGDEGEGGLEMELPPLRRMGDRTVRDRSPNPATTTIIEAYTVEEIIDSASSPPSSALEVFPAGLGDRERSVEVEGEEEEEEESWDTMFSTLAPDERLPSASSSFASDAASRSFSASSASSSRAASSFSAGTGITVPDEREGASGVREGRGTRVGEGRGIRIGDAQGIEGCDTVEVWRTIGERFNRGEDVPDELWVNAGVPEDTARILGRSRRGRL